ncbi:MAG: hypothetical protein FD166_1461 [Bacteroidetes bacterium]|nr:MAG: hypothetical protein FD166_1461 [Bacteroidota bacterium]
MHFDLVKVDRVIGLFQNYYPVGSDFSNSTFDFLDKREKDSILKFLLLEGILDPWDSASKYIISARGLEISSEAGGIKGYLDQKLKQTEENYRMEIIHRQKLRKEAKRAQKKSWITRLFGNKI